MQIKNTTILKYSILLVSIIGILSSASAQTNAFPLAVKGGISFEQSGSVGKLSFTQDSLVTAGNRLVLVMDLTNKELRLVEVDVNAALVRTLYTSFRFAILPDGSFSSDLENALDPDTFDEIPVELGDFSGSGNLQITGKVSSGKLKGTLSGVFNDSNTFVGSEVDILMKAKVSALGPQFTPTDL